jgi:hypothetical protein
MAIFFVGIDTSWLVLRDVSIVQRPRAVLDRDIQQ